MRRWSRKETDIYFDYVYVWSKRFAVIGFVLFVGLYLINSITNDDFELWTFLIIVVGTLSAAVGSWGLAWTARYILIPMFRRWSSGL